MRRMFKAFLICVVVLIAPFCQIVVNVFNRYMCKYFGHGDNLGKLAYYKGLYGRWCNRCHHFRNG